MHGVTVPEEGRRTLANPDGIDVDGDGHPRIQKCIALLGMSGRSLFKLKLFDRWDLLPWSWGGPRTGKTTLCKVLTSFTNATTITYGTEGKFGLNFLF